MILAAGRGERMRPLTDTTPKPLLKINGKPLIQYHIEALKKAGIEHIVVNVAWLGEKLIEFLGDGSQFGISISISHEKDGALETAGGIRKALPLLSTPGKPNDAFIVLNGDVFTDYDFSQLPKNIDDDMHLVLVDNPEHNIEGDFFYNNNRIIDGSDSGSDSDSRLTFSGIGVYKASIFSNLEENTAERLKVFFEAALQKQSLSAEHFTGKWVDVGTPERLAQLND